MSFINLTGQKFGRLTVIGFSHKDKHRQIHWFCQCECGNKNNPTITKLRNGTTHSCGCKGKENRTEMCIKARKTHGKSATVTYNIWAGMKARCINKNEQHYKDYGGRGIKVCDKWLTFEGFYEDMGDRPKGKTIDRIDNDGDYCKENCKWSTPIEQSNNKRNNIKITYGEKTLSAAKWAEITGIKKETLIRRIFNYKWSVEKAINQKTRRHSRGEAL